MDDSVIKVLRRNGSWKEGRNNSMSQNETIKKKSQENDFNLDQKFGILAAEIKKRMQEKSSSHYNNIDKNLKSRNLSVSNSSELQEKFNKLKRQLLPHLTEVENLIHQRELHLQKINNIDSRLEKIKSDIITVKEKYQNDLDSMQKNIDFFDESLKIIDSIREE